MAQALSVLWTAGVLLVIAGSGWAFLKLTVRGLLIEAGGILSALLLAGVGLDYLARSDEPALTWLALFGLPFSCGMILVGVAACILKSVGFGKRRRFPSRMSGYV